MDVLEENSVILKEHISIFGNVLVLTFSQTVLSLSILNKTHLAYSTDHKITDRKTDLLTSNVLFKGLT